MAKDKDQGELTRIPLTPVGHVDQPAPPGAPKAPAETPPGDQPITVANLGDRLLSLASGIKEGHAPRQKLYDELMKLGGAAKSGGRI